MIAWLRRWHVLHDWEVRYPSAFDLIDLSWSRGPRTRRYTCRTCGLIKRYEVVETPINWQRTSPITVVWERIRVVDAQGQLTEEYDPIIVEANARRQRRARG